MQFLHLTDVDGKRHIINPLHIVAVEESEGGCVVHMRGHDVTPIQLSESVEVIGEALDCCGVDDPPSGRH
jgi:hypothetical protein